MKRIIPMVLAFCFTLTSAVTPYAQAATTAVESSTETTKAKSSKPAVSEYSDNESNATNPIGDNSSYHNISDLKNAPSIEAESAILINADTGAVLYKKKSKDKRYPASITKVMTALLTIENCSMDETVKFSSEAVNGIEPGSSSAGIPVGAELTVEETLYAMMLLSANEAAAALAEHVSGSIDEFAKLMTKRAKELGCEKTQFKNPHGLPDENHYTTAADMSLIVKQAIKYKEFRKIAGAETFTIKSRPSMSDTLELWNHGKIIRKNSEYYYKYAEGVKTGFTQAALNTLISYSKKGDVELICIILKDYGAPSSYTDSKNLYDWGFSKVKVLKPLKDFDLNKAIDDYPNLTDDQKVAMKSLNATYNKDYLTLTRINYDTKKLNTAFNLQEDKNAGVLGTVMIRSNDKLIGECPVTYDITSDNAVKYINNKTDSNDSSTPKKVATTIKSSSRKEIIVCIVSILVILLIIFLFIRSTLKKLKSKTNKKKSAQNIRKELEEHPPTRRRHKK